MVQELTLFTEKNIKRLTLLVHANLVAAPSEGGTPVDTGWARANWVPAIGSARSGTVGTRASAEKGSIDLGPAERGIAIVATRYKLRQGPIFVSNGVPYIESLNDGSSGQAPRAFVQTAILRAIRQVARAA